MRLIVKYTYLDDYIRIHETIPLTWSSKEEFIKDFKEAAMRNTEQFFYAGSSWHHDDFFNDDNEYEGPEVLTVDEYFSSAYVYESDGMS